MAQNLSKEFAKMIDERGILDIRRKAKDRDEFFAYIMISGTEEQLRPIHQRWRGTFRKEHNRRTATLHLLYKQAMKALDDIEPYSIQKEKIKIMRQFYELRGQCSDISPKLALQALIRTKKPAKELIFRFPKFGKMVMVCDNNQWIPGIVTEVYASKAVDLFLLDKVNGPRFLEHVQHAQIENKPFWRWKENNI